jgi:hypothetical protein
MNSQKLMKLSESVIIFGDILNQLQYAFALYDEYSDKRSPEYYGGRFPHPFSMLAEEKILMELDNFDSESKRYGKLMGRQVPIEYVVFNRHLKSEGWAKQIRNQLIAHKRRDKNGRFISTQEMYKVFHPDPNAIRQMGEELRVVLYAIIYYYMKDPRFPGLKKTVEGQDPTHFITI